MPALRKVPLSRLDPKAPFVLDTRELGRRPGSLRRVTRTVPAPADLRLEVIGVPEGSPIELELRLEAVMEGVLVSGSASAQLAGECARCLDPVEGELTVDVQQLYRYPGEHAGRDDEDDDELPELQGDLLDLEPVVRDAVVLELPMRPLCREDCPGLCQQCGARLADEPAHRHDTTDARWAALTRLTGTPPIDPTKEKS